MPEIEKKPSLGLLYIGAVLCHLLTSFVIMAGIIGVYLIYKVLSNKLKKIKLYSVVICFLLLIIFIAFQIMFLERSFYVFLELLIGQIIQQETHVALITQSRVIGSFNLQMEIWGTYGITIISVILAVISRDEDPETMSFIPGCRSYRYFRNNPASLALCTSSMKI